MQVKSKKKSLLSQALIVKRFKHILFLIQISYYAFLMYVDSHIVYFYWTRITGASAKNIMSIVISFCT